MPKSPFIPDKFLARLTKKLSSFGRKEALDDLRNHFGEPVFIAQNYVQPHCQFENPADHADNDVIERHPIFRIVNAFLDQNECGGEGNPCDSRRRSHDSSSHSNSMFLLGDTGMGKTSLLVLLKLAQLTALWPSHYHCKLLKLGASTVESIGNIKTPRKTILLLDGLNQDPGALEDVFGRLSEILRATRGFYRVILTGRTAYAPGGRHDSLSGVGKLASEGFGCTTVFLSPFNDTQMDRYLKRRFRRMEKPAQIRAKSILNEMRSLKASPLLLCHVDDLVHSPCVDWNAFSTYEALVDAWLDREQGKIRSTDSHAKFRKDTLLDALIKMARLMQLGETRCCVSKSDLSESHLQESEQEHVRMLDCKGRSFLRMDSAGTYRFTHASIQEFLIASGVKNGLLHSGKKRMPATQLIITFLLGNDEAGTEWRALDLTTTSLACAELQDADFSRSLLVAANLQQCAFHKTTFDNADLTSCEANEATFHQCSFAFTKAANASLRFAAFSETQFINASFSGAVLSKATFVGCKFDHAGLADSNLGSSSFAQSTISDCSFKSSRLCAVEFSDCSLANVKLDRSSLTGAKFSNTSLQNVSLQCADMRGTNLDTTFLNAVRAGAAKNWKSAAWDPEVAAALKLSSKENVKNAEAIVNDLSR